MDSSTHMIGFICTSDCVAIDVCVSHIHSPFRLVCDHLITGLFQKLSFALCDLLFSESSFSLGRIGFLVITLPFETLPQTQTGKSGGHVHGFSLVLKLFFAILSSNEWKVITQSLPPGFKKSMNPSSEPDKTSSSLFKAIRTRLWRPPLSSSQVSPP